MLHWRKFLLELKPEAHSSGYAVNGSVLSRRGLEMGMWGPGSRDVGSLEPSGVSELTIDRVSCTRAYKQLKI